MLDMLLTLLGVSVGLYAGFRMFRRALRNLWQRVQPFILSSWASWRGSRNTGNPIPMRVPAQIPVVREPVPVQAEPADTVHNDTPKWHARVAILAAMKDDNDKPLFTNDEIVAKIGKRRADVLAQINIYRPKQAADPQKHSFTRAELDAA